MRKLITGKILKPSDFILAGLIGLIAVAFLVAQGNPTPSSESPAVATVIVEVSGKETHAIPFSEVSSSQMLKIQAGVDQCATLEILGSGKARIVESTCPDKVCINMGWITRSGQVIVCLPNRIVVRIENSGTISDDANSGLDAITY